MFASCLNKSTLQGKELAMKDVHSGRRSLGIRQFHITIKGDGNKSFRNERGKKLFISTKTRPCRNFNTAHANQLDSYGV
jgi:hypothetical protein